RRSATARDARPLCDAVVSRDGPLAGIDVLRQLRLDPPRRPAAPARAGAAPGRHARGGVCRVARVLQHAERHQHAARPPALCGHQDLSRRAADEAGPDEHGDLDREPRAVPRPQAGRVRGDAARRLEAVGVHDQACAARVDEGRAAGVDSQPAEDGLPGAVCGLDAGPWNATARDVLLDRRSRERGLIDPQAVDALLRDHAARRTDGGDRIWSLLNLELWHRTFIDREGIQTLPAPASAGAYAAPAGAALASPGG